MGRRTFIGIRKRTLGPSHLWTGWSKEGDQFPERSVREYNGAALPPHFATGLTPQGIALSYDLMVFDPHEAPIDRVAFLAWFHGQGENDEPFDPTRHEFSCVGLRSWLEEMLPAFPAMNGVYAKEDLDADDPRLSDYALNRTNIYVNFAWSQSKVAYETCIKLAERHRVGVFDVSDRDATIWRPDENGLLCPTSGR